MTAIYRGTSRLTPTSFPLSPCTFTAPPPTPVALNGGKMLPHQTGCPMLLFEPSAERVGWNVPLLNQQWQCRSLQSNVLGGTWLWMCSSSKGRSIGLRLPPVSRHGSGFPLLPWMPRRTGRWVSTATAGLFRLDSAGIWMQYNSSSVGRARAACSDLLLIQRPREGLNGIIHCSLQDTERLCAGV